MSVTRLPDPAPVPVCRICWEPLDLEKPTGRYKGVRAHTDCIEWIEAEGYDAFITGEHK